MSIPKNRWLFVALGLVVLGFAGEEGFKRFYEEPAEKNERAKEQLHKRLQTAKTELTKSKKVIDHLAELEQKSLPWDAEMARERYQDWLLQLAKEAKLTGTSVDSGEPMAVTTAARRGKRSTEMFKRFAFTLNGRGDLRQVTKFMYDFYRGGHLHKIRTLTLNPIGQGQEVAVSLAIEALALPNADREAELTTLVSEQLAQADVRDYQLIAHRNFFSSGGTSAAWKQIQLSAVTSDSRGVAEAWFNLGPDSPTQILQVGQSLSLPSCELQVVSLEETAATLSVDGQMVRIAIGQSLTEATAAK